LIGSASQEVPDHKKDRPGAEVGDEELDRTPGYMSLMNFFSHRQLRTSFKAMSDATANFESTYLRALSHGLRFLAFFLEIFLQLDGL
jgi:hypothetical protein